LLSTQDFAAFQAQFPNRAIATSAYTYDELATIYNDARTDYIVPMPMNGKRMGEYVAAYDINLDASLVAVDPDDNLPNGICMLGVRDKRTWITRLGVIPERRRRKSGEFLMRAEIEETQKRGIKQIQLEVIKGNDPAYHLFSKMGFEAIRELLVIRRPPGALDASLIPAMTVETIMSEAEITNLLAQREPGAAWTEETPSLLNAGSLRALRVTLPDNESGWIVFQRSLFQLAHFVLAPNVSPEMTAALIIAVHREFPNQDTKIENVPTEHYTWRAYEHLGYMVTFSRIEMLLQL
jgi:ribosomal protein S18 acetylase RimI-like enzyme